MDVAMTIRFGDQVAFYEGDMAGLCDHTTTSHFYYLFDTQLSPCAFKLAAGEEIPKGRMKIDIVEFLEIGKSICDSLHPELLLDADLWQPRFNSL
jgi:hypothetical protein